MAWYGRLDQQLARGVKLRFLFFLDHAIAYMREYDLNDRMIDLKTGHSWAIELQKEMVLELYLDRLGL
jgi:hypothetical protein